MPVAPRTWRENQTLGEGEAPVFYRPEREAWVLKHIMQLNKGPLDNEEVARLFREIMSSCLALEQPLKVAYLGPGAPLPRPRRSAFRQRGDQHADGGDRRGVPRGRCRRGELRRGACGKLHRGAVNHTLDSFLEHDMVICGEVELRIHHHLLVGETTGRQHHPDLFPCPIPRAMSQVAGLALPERRAGGGVEQRRRGKRVKSEWNSAAIAGDMAASLYDLSKLHEIEDRPDNSTRFLIIGNQEVPPTGDDKTSIIVSMRNKPGALHELLVPFHNNGIDLTRIETRPSRGKWTYVFFIDFVGHHKEPLIKDVLEIGQEAVALKVLGSYPKAVL